MAEQSVRGRFVWHELMTPDTAGAHAFYSKALNWKSQAWDQDPSYNMFAAASGPIGAPVALPTGAPHWLHYIGTPDINATVQQAKGLGAKVTQDVQSIPSGGGKYAVLTDPQGATFALYESAAPAQRETAPKRGEFSWHELATTDYNAAFQFYSTLFGWENQHEHDMGPDGKYLVFGSNGMSRGGMFNKFAQMQGPPAWLGYVRVKDVQQALKKIKAARGTLVNGPMEVPGGDWIAQFSDPYGAMFAVHALAADVSAGQGADAPADSAAQPAAKPAAAKPAASEKGGAGKPAAQKPAAGQAAAKAAVKKPAAKQAAAKPAAKKPATKQKAAAKPAAKPAAKKAASKKRRAAAKAAKRPARKAAKKAGRKVARKSNARSGAKKAAKKARKAK